MPMQTSILYFDQFELDLNSYELGKSGRVIKLEKLPMELLILLAESQGQLVTRGPARRGSRSLIFPIRPRSPHFRPTAI
jgi:DNA-binding response OmpR family regulator